MCPERTKDRYADVLQYGFLAWLRSDVPFAHPRVVNAVASEPQMGLNNADAARRYTNHQEKHARSFASLFPSE